MTLTVTYYTKQTETIEIPDDVREPEDAIRAVLEAKHPNARVTLPEYVVKADGGLLDLGRTVQFAESPFPFAQ